jgi:hypothetical protein
VVDLDTALGQHSSTSRYDRPYRGTDPADAGISCHDHGRSLNANSCFGVSGSPGGLLTEERQ